MRSGIFGVISMRLGIHKLAALCFLAVLGATAPAHADLIVSLQPVTSTPKPGDIGDALEVVLSNSGASVNLNSFFFDVSTTDTDITFTDATAATVINSYIFAANSTFGPDIVNPGFTPGQEISASDIASAPDFTTLGTGGVVSLGEVFYNVAPNAVVQPFAVTFNQAGTSLSDDLGNNIPIDQFQSATLDISAVPEPSSILLLLTGTAFVLGLARRKRS